MCFLVPPSVPLYPVYTVTSHDTSSFLILLEWTKPQSNGGLGVKNYTTTLRVANSVHTYVETSDKLYLSLFYNLRYTVKIVAANCAGYSLPEHVIPDVYESKCLDHSVEMNQCIFIAVNCGLPIFPAVNGSSKITYFPTHVGSIVQFMCVYNKEIITLECLDNGTWIPDPTGIQCSDIQQM